MTRNYAREGMIFNNSVLLAIRNTANDKAINKDIILACSDIICNAFDEFDKQMEQKYGEHTLQTEHKPKVDFKINKITL